MTRGLLFLSIFMALENPLFAKSNKPFEFVDIVYKIQEEKKGQAFVSFHRHPSIYELEIGSVEKSDTLMKLESSQKNKKPVKVLVDPKSKKISKVLSMKR